MVIRSFEAGNSIIPDSANSASGKTSVCSTRAAIASRSAAVPGTAAAWAANALAPSLDLALGEHQDRDGAEDQQDRPHEVGRPVDGQRADRD